MGERVESARGVHRQTLGVVNWYLVEDGGRLTAVDAGTPADWDLLIAALRGLGRALDDVEAVLLTHAHSDHTGFAERARTEAAARVLVHGDERARVQGGDVPPNEAGMARYLLRAEAWRTSIRLVRRGGHRMVHVAEVGTYADGETVDVPGRPRAIHTPGHTEGSAALWFEDRSALCAGDALVTHNVLTGRSGPQIMPAAFNVDSARALASLSALEATGAGVILPGHGEPWTAGVAEAVELARVAGRS